MTIKNFKIKNKNKITEKHANTWRLKNMLLNKGKVNNEIKEEVKSYLGTNENEHKTNQNLWDTEKTVLRGMFIALQAYLKKQEKYQIKNLTLYLK